MDIVSLKLSELHPYENNPRQNDDAVDAVAASIKEFGFKVPIVVDKNNVIVAGHTRYKAAKKLNLKTVPCVVADDLSEEQVNAFRLWLLRSPRRLLWLAMLWLMLLFAILSSRPLVSCSAAAS